MSFTKGFEKVAGPLGAISKGVGTAVRGAQKAVKGVKEFALAKRLERTQGFREGLSGANKTQIGQTAANSAVKKLQANNPGISFNELHGAAQKIKKDKAKAVLQRKDRMDQSRAKASEPFYKKHPLLTAGGVYLGAKAMLGNDQQQPPQPPPQIVQY